MIFTFFELSFSGIVGLFGLIIFALVVPTISVKKAQFIHFFLNNKNQ